MKPLAQSVRDYNGLTLSDDDARYHARLYKDSATWSWFTENEVGGGFGSNAVTSQRDAVARALTNVPKGTPVSISIDHEPRGVYVRAEETS